MLRQIKGIILIFLGLSIFFPELFNLMAFKIILALVLIWFGFKLLFGNNIKSNNYMNKNG
ncbi:hypothetical protein GF322_00840 [Candidatus Dependentiae bacterium]|nr:hypothetical protein [Candidatus Dependentiae bacterium]